MNDPQTKSVDNKKSLQFSQEAVAMMQKLLTPKSKEEVVEIFAKYLDIAEAESVEAVNKLVQTGVLLEGNFSMRDQTSLYSCSYSDHDSQRAMLLDLARTDSYRRAIISTISPGNRVIDVGSGSGILSLFAASAGASKVFAIEVTSMVNTARKLAITNNLDDKIEFFHTFAQNVSLDIKVDVIVSEWMGMFLMEEYMFDAVQIIRDRFLVEGGLMIPNAVDLYIVPIEDRALYYKTGFGFWKSSFFGYDFNIDVKEDDATDRFLRCVVKPESLIAHPSLLLHFDCMKDTTADFHFSKNIEFVVERDACFHGFCGYFDTILTNQIILSTSPKSQTTSWKQAYFPIAESIVKKNDVIQLHMITNPGSKCPDIILKGSVVRNNKIVTTFHSKPFIDGALTPKSMK